jgi:diguanylate cyclase (GGDEF)-like protein
MEWLLLGGVALATVIGWMAGRTRGQGRRRRWSMTGLRDPVFTQQPELAWVARANGALAAWLRRGTDGGVAALVLDRRVADVLHRLVVSRLSAAPGREGGRTEVERLDEGVLLYVVTPEIQVALLLASERGVPQARGDLEALAGVLRAQGALRTAAPGSSASADTLRAAAVHLAFELERTADLEVGIAVRRPRGVQVVATSASADPHLVRRYAVPHSTVDLIAQGRVPGAAVSWDPLGDPPRDRRRRSRPAFVFPIADTREQTFGAAILWTRDGSEPRGPQRGRIESLLRAAGPRLREALERLELEEQAVRDPLTGLLNRRGFQERMGLVHHDRAALLVCDLDHFKHLNDTLGHPAGDAALRRVAEVLEDAVRAQDAVARLDGEEFAVWLPGTGLDEALQVAERLRARIADLWWTWQGRQWLLSVSVGVAGWPDTARSRENLLPQADAALYKAKESGRNRVVAAR